MSERMTPDRDDLRDQLAIHAPAVPDWFQPQMGAKRPEPPRPPESLSPAASSIATRIIFQEGYSSSLWDALDASERAQLDAFKWARNEWFRAVESYDAKSRALRVASWPWAYADMVLAESGASRWRS